MMWMKPPKRRGDQMKKLSILLCLLLTAIIASEAWAKRAAPAPVTPVVHKGVKYVAPNANGLEGKIEARNEETGKILWDVVIYTIKIDPSLEQDVQWVFITGLAVQDNTLLVTNEKNEQYILDLMTRKVEKVKKDEKEKP
jgi:NTP pyrophosphatase (non-canonical NTP hydrolase)